MSDAANNYLFTIVLQLAIHEGLKSIEVGAAESTEIKIDPNAKVDPDLFAAAVFDLIADVDWQETWKRVELNSGNPDRDYITVKRRHPSYRSIPNSIWDKLFIILRSRNDPALAILELPKPKMGRHSQRLDKLKAYLEIHKTVHIKLVSIESEDRKWAKRQAYNALFQDEERVGDNDNFPRWFDDLIYRNYPNPKLNKPKEPTARQRQKRQAKRFQKTEA